MPLAQAGGAGGAPLDQVAHRRRRRRRRARARGARLAHARTATRPAPAGWTAWPSVQRARVRPAAAGPRCRRRRRRRGAAGRAARHVLGHRPAHRPRPRPGPARQPGPLPDPRSACSASSPPASSRSTCPRRRARPAAVRIAGDWYAPVGGVLMLACGALRALGFPLDDIWHRLFGQDVTLWGPTHLMLIGGAGDDADRPGRAARRGPRARAAARRGRPAPRCARRAAARLRRVGLMGGLLIGLSTFQAEFDFGVPQFRAGPPAAADRVRRRRSRWSPRGMWIGRGGALGAVALLPRRARRACSLLVGPVLRRDDAALAALPRRGAARRARRARGSRARGRSLLGAAAGGADRHGRLRRRVGAGRHVAMPLPWTPTLLPEALCWPRRRRRRRRCSAALLGAGAARRAAARPARRPARRRWPRCVALVAVHRRPACVTERPRRRDARTVTLPAPAGDGARPRPSASTRPDVAARRRVGRGDRLAGRRTASSTGCGAPAPASYRHHRAGPARRRLEDADPPARRPRAARRPRPAARGLRRSRRPRSPPPRAASARFVDETHASCSASSKQDVDPAGSGRRAARGARPRPGLAGTLAWGVGRVARAARAVGRRRRAGSPRRAADGVPAGTMYVWTHAYEGRPAALLGAVSLALADDLRDAGRAVAPHGTSGPAGAGGPPTRIWADAQSKCSARGLALTHCGHRPGVVDRLAEQASWGPDARSSRSISHHQGGAPRPCGSRTQFVGSGSVFMTGLTAPQRAQRAALLEHVAAELKLTVD